MGAPPLEHAASTASVATAAKLRASAVTPERFLQVIGRALAPAPDVILFEITWQNRTSEISAASDNPAPGGTAQNRPAAGTSAATGPRKQSGLIAGQVRDFRGDFRGAIAQINTLAERLRKDPSVENVRIVQLPLNVNPALALTGNTAENPAQSGTADFKMIIVLRQPT